MDSLIEAGRSTTPRPGRRVDHYDMVVVDSCRLFREGLTGILVGSPFNVVAAVARIDDLAADDAVGPVDLVICSLDPQCSVEPQLAGIRATRKRDPGTKIVLLMPACTAADLVAAVLCGVDGIILKDVSGAVLRAGLILVMHGQSVLPPAAASEVFSTWRKRDDAAEPATVPSPAAAEPDDAPPVSPEPSPRPDPARAIICPSVFAAADAAAARDRAPTLGARSLGLSDREMQILACLVEGCSNKMIARKLDITEATVKVHIKGLLRKINVSNRTQAAIWGLNQTMTGRRDADSAFVAASVPAADPSHEAAILTQRQLLSEIVTAAPCAAAASSSRTI